MITSRAQNRFRNKLKKIHRINHPKIPINLECENNDNHRIKLILTNYVWYNIILPEINTGKNSKQSHLELIYKIINFIET